MIFERKIYTINRSILIVRPKQPYIDWANSMDDGGPLANLKSMRKSPNTFLIDEIYYDDDLSLIIDEYWETLFEIQLNNWMRDPDVWPEVLTREMFEKWFDYELFDMVWDITGKRIKRQFQSIS